jgi:hypothetical protein
MQMMRVARTTRPLWLRERTNQNWSGPLTGGIQNRPGAATKNPPARWKHSQSEIILMRALVLTALLLLASSALYPASAIDAKTDVQTHQQKSSDENTTGQSSHNREVGRDWKMKSGNDQTVGKVCGTSEDQAESDRRIDCDWK